MISKYKTFSFEKSSGNCEKLKLKTEKLLGCHLVINFFMAQPNSFHSEAKVIKQPKVFKNSSKAEKNVVARNLWHPFL